MKKISVLSLVLLASVATAQSPTPQYVQKTYVDSKVAAVVIPGVKTDGAHGLKSQGTMSAGSTYDLNIASFGDSITAGYSATIPAKDYMHLWSAGDGFNLTNNGVPSTQIQDWITALESTTITSSQYSILPGYNDMRFKGTDATWEGVYSDSLSFFLTFAGIPTSKLVYADAAAQTGSWNTTSAYQHIGVNSSTASSTLTATVSGTVVYIGSIRIPTGGSFSVTVDGVSKGTFSCDTSAPADNAGVTYHPFLVRIASLSAGSHTIVVTQASGGSNVYIEFFGGNAVGSNLPRVFVGSTLHMNSTGYACCGPNFNSGSDSAVTAYNAINSAAVTQLSGDGLSIYYVNLDSVYNLSTDVYGDNIHPNDTGHAHIAAAFQAAYDALPIQTSCPGGASAGSICAASKFYGDGSQLTNLPSKFVSAPIFPNSTGSAGQYAIDSGSNLYVYNGASSLWAKFTGGSTSWTGPQEYDTFTGTNGTVLTSHTSDLSHTWALYTGVAGGGDATAKLNGSNAVTTSTGGFSFMINSLAPGSANYTTCAAFTVQTFSGASAYLFGRIAGPSTNTSYYTIYSQGTGIKLFKQVTGSNTQIGSTVGGDWALNSVHTLCLAIGSSSQTVTHNGASIITGTDSTITAAGQAGFGVTGSGSMLVSTFSVQ